ncbi:MAG: ABC transporter substrate-binding protein [Alphaproteobacteria bacterium]|nr:ABC transporter substrate-binding protein [Alphaproteobacteria bacterium]
MIKSAGWAILALMLAPPAAEGATFRYAASADLLGLDPYINNDGITNAMKGNLYEGLLTRRFDMTLAPALATEWTRTAPEVWRFRLRPGVTFHDGTPFTAADVLASFARITHDQSVFRAAMSGIREIRKLDDLGVEIITKVPDATLEQELPILLVMCKRWLEANNTEHVLRGSNAATFANSNANGTGPFRLVGRLPDIRTVVEPYPDWWGRPEHNLTRAEFRPISNAPARQQALLFGEVDMAYPVHGNDVPRLEQAGIRVITGPDLRTVFLGFDSFREESLDLKGRGRNPFKDRRVREAFRKAIDLQVLHVDVMRGLSRPTGSMIAPGIEGYSNDLDTPSVYDPEGAAHLLAQAGYANGFPVTLDCTNDRYDNDEAICRRVALMLARIRITVKLNVQPRADYFEKASQRGGYNTSFFILGWTPATFDGLNALTSVMGAGGGANFGRYVNPKIDILARKAAQEQDPALRRHLIQQALTIHKHDVGHVPLHQQVLAWGVRPTVADIKSRPWNDVDLRWVWMK